MYPDYKYCNCLHCDPFTSSPRMEPQTVVDHYPEDEDDYTVEVSWPDGIAGGLPVDWTQSQTITASNPLIAALKFAVTSEHSYTIHVRVTHDNGVAHVFTIESFDPDMVAPAVECDAIFRGPAVKLGHTLYTLRELGA